MSVKVFSVGGAGSFSARGQEGGHLASGDGFLGAEAGAVGVAAEGDPGFGDGGGSVAWGALGVGESSGVVGGGQFEGALVRKAAIWPLVTGFWGQKRVPSGLQPRVMPTAAILLMDSSKMLPSSSVKESTGTGVGSGSRWFWIGWFWIGWLGPGWWQRWGRRWGRRW